jgi:hypothetical protein
LEGDIFEQFACEELIKAIFQLGGRSEFLLNVFYTPIDKIMIQYAKVITVNDI